jgi:hypothetical protein
MLIPNRPGSQDLWCNQNRGVESYRLYVFTTGESSRVFVIWELFWFPESHFTNLKIVLRITFTGVTIHKIDFGLLYLPNDFIFMFERK